MKVEFACRVEKGVRETNDDRALILHRILNEESFSGESEVPAAAIVCDGCGGYAGGGVAATMVLETMDAPFPEVLADPERLAEVLDAAKGAVFRAKEQEPTLAQMCTTVVGCAMDENRTIFFHSGDSRAYRFDGRYLAKMTVDHSAVQMMVDMGRITPEQALVDPARNIILRCIGIDGEPPEIYTMNSPIAPGDTYLLCSDGLWEYVREPELREILSRQGTLAEKADWLVQAALDAGGDDNITACLFARTDAVQVQEAEEFILD